VIPNYRHWTSWEKHGFENRSAPRESLLIISLRERKSTTKTDLQETLIFRKLLFGIASPLIFGKVSSVSAHFFHDS